MAEHDPLPAGDDQSGTIAFLSDPASHDGAAEDMERIETHCSIVFLAGDRAYKLKRAIRYSSLDYTTRDARLAACQAELTLNRRTAPDLYLGVRSINRDNSGHLAFDGPGPALDHVVVMRRFAQSDLFDRLEERGALTQVPMRELGEAVAHLHRSAEPAPGFGGARAIRDVIANNAVELHRVAPALDGAAMAELSAQSRCALDALAPLLERRRAEGKVRRCHGDLRLANICLWSGRPTLFDCIEFSEEIGCIDVLYDLAFLLMDLHLRGRGDLGNAVFNSWLDLMPETEGLRALPLFLALRAATRSYALAGGAQRAVDPEQATRLLALARRHIRASMEFLRPRDPLLIVVGGENPLARRELVAMLAAVAAPAPGARIVHVRQSGEAAWREANAVLAAGCSVAIEDAFGDEAQRGIVADVASSLGVRSLGFLLTARPAARSDTGFWHGLDAGRGVLAAVATAAPLISSPMAATSPEDRARRDI